MIEPIFKKTILLSLLGHLTAFGIFSFSSGNKLPDLSQINISFWGGFLKGYDFTSPNSNFNKPFKPAFNLRPVSPLPEKIDSPASLEQLVYFKPSARLLIESEKPPLVKNLAEEYLPKIRKQPVVMLYPKLPYHFSLYFKDRQLVHIALDYKIITGDKVSSIIIQRKISSGNPEADLLCMRYINLYLSIQRERFTPNKWQTVKIELEPKK
ncbi:MAG: hypothetical protein MUC39_05325 [Candidatus Omnitrophica bacterium]|jgi:hypothetical protein|nr:hypothetical protein [Candidatus Omnitrophota bacterium]